MKQKLTRTVAADDIRHAETLNGSTGSDKQCSRALSESASEASCDSPRRASRVGLRGGRNREYTLAEKLAARIIKRPNGCWEVQGHALPNGYVQLSIGSPWNPPYKRVRAHVFAWEQANGRKVPPGMEVMHACDNPRCANPAHLSVGTHRANILDSIHKGRYNCFGRQKLDAAKVHEIRALGARGFKHKDIAAKFGVGRSAVTSVLTGATWTHLPFANLSNVDRVPHVHLEIRGEVG